MGLPPIEDKFPCPHCGKPIRLSEAAAKADTLRIEELMTAFGRDRAVAESYLACFATASGRAVEPKRLRPVLEELVEIWRSRSFTFRRKNYSVPESLLRSMLYEVGQRVEKLRGFKNHNYLKIAVLNQLPKYEAEAERKHYENHRTGTSRREEPAAPVIRDMVEGIAGDTRRLPSSRPDRGEVVAVSPPESIAASLYQRLTPEQQHAADRISGQRQRKSVERPADYEASRQRLIEDLRRGGKSEAEINRLLPQA